MPWSGGSARRSAAEPRQLARAEKNVPLNRNIGVSPKRNTALNPWSFFWVAAKAMIGAAKASPVRTATGIARTPSGQTSVARRENHHGDEDLSIRVIRTVIQASWPKMIPGDGTRGAATIPWKVRVPDQGGHDRVRRSAACCLHRLGRQQARRQEEPIAGSLSSAVPPPPRSTNVPSPMPIAVRNMTGDRNVEKIDPWQVRR